jgi:hypothetical protein
MQETIAQVLGLAMHGNAFLRGAALGAFWPDATFFGYCRSVRFVPAEPDARRAESADPDSWLRSLPPCPGLRVRVARRGPPGFGERMTVGFVDGGSLWLIEELGGPRPLAWSAAWSFADRKGGDGQIWSVAYRGEPADPAPPLPPDLDRVERDLRAALEAISRFAERIGSRYGESFRRALACLDGAQPFESRYHPDLAPPGLLSGQASRILAACDAGWVFGGMGSWNDGAYGGADCEEGDLLSDRLFDGLQGALADAANSTAAPLSPTTASGSRTLR